MTIRELEIFVATAKCGKMSQAAKELYITQSSVSQVIAELERSHGVTLFDRLGRSLYLTPTGEALLTYAEGLLSQYRAIEVFLREASQKKSLRIGATLTIGGSIMSRLLLGLERRCPHLQSEITIANTRELESLLLKNELDIAIVEGEVTSPELVVQPAVSDQLVLAFGRGHPLQGRGSVPLQELQKYPLILREKGSGTREQLEHALIEQKIPYTVHWTSCSTEAIKLAVIDGHGVTVIGRRLITRELESGALSACTIGGFHSERTFDLVYHRKKYLSSALQTFMELTLNFGEVDRIRSPYSTSAEAGGTDGPPLKNGF